MAKFSKGLFFLALLIAVSVASVTGASQPTRITVWKPVKATATATKPVDKTALKNADNADIAKNDKVDDKKALNKNILLKKPVIANDTMEDSTVDDATVDDTTTNNMDDTTTMDDTATATMNNTATNGTVDKPAERALIRQVTASRFIAPGYGFGGLGYGGLGFGGLGYGGLGFGGLGFGGLGYGGLGYGGLGYGGYGFGGLGYGIGYGRFGYGGFFDEDQNATESNNGTNSSSNNINQQEGAAPILLRIPDRVMQRLIRRFGQSQSSQRDNLIPVYVDVSSLQSNTINALRLQQQRRRLWAVPNSSRRVWAGPSSQIVIIRSPASSDRDVNRMWMENDE